MMLILAYFMCTIWSAASDVYIHNRGSNNRLGEKNFNRDNAKRLFNSQNNNRGGYNVGNVWYYHGSEVELEWTNQHSCGGPNNNCEVVIQYMCDPKLRDGRKTTTIPDKEESDDDSEFGRHESYYYYLRCKTRRRNMRLFTADQKLKKDTAIHTRQNPGGTRYGYECQEERDYYPYWHGSPWRDIAVLTNNVSRCDYYQSESQNVKERWECVYTTAELQAIARKGLIVPNNEAQCQTERPGGFTGAWTNIPSHGIPPPDCRETQFTRDNHVGHTEDLKTPRYKFTVPEVDSHNCAIRVRYNISTHDYDSWNTDSLNNAVRRGNVASKIDLASTYDLSSKEAYDRGYIFENNPQVQIFDDADFKLELAVNTAQYGRTFQDRTHTTGFRPRPDELTGVKIHNINVRGKRGNIVQVYPAVEYDFVPNSLDMSKGDYVQFQWTGSDTNPNNAAGNGRAGTDRSNVVRLTGQNYPEVNKYSHGLDDKYGYYGNNYPEHLNTSGFLGLGREQLENLAYLSNMQYGGLDMTQLDDASPYFNLAPQRVTKTGTYYYMSTRNNDFSNRDQKAVIHVYPYAIISHFLGQRGGTIVISERVSMQVEEGALCGLNEFKFEEWPRAEGDAKAAKLNRAVKVGKDYASDYIIVYPVEKYCIMDNKQVTMSLKIDDTDDDISVYRTNPATFASWTKINSKTDDGKVLFQVDQGGAYVVRIDNNRNVGLIVGCVVAVVVVGLVIGTAIYFRRHPNKFSELKGKARNCGRGLHSKV